MLLPKRRFASLVPNAMKGLAEWHATLSVKTQGGRPSLFSSLR